MKTLVAYDSEYGNTEKIAEAIGGAISGDVRVVRASNINPSDLAAIDLLIVGSPTQGGRPTQPVQDLIVKTLGSLVNGVKVAAFDTRYGGRFVKVFGFAADRIAAALTERGGRLVSPPMAFFVTGKKGPLKEGELERSATWARGILK